MSVNSRCVCPELGLALCFANGQNRLVWPSRHFGVSAGLLAAFLSCDVASVKSLAGEPLPVSGQVLPNASRGFFSSAFLLDPVSREIVAGLIDPMGLLGNAERAILQTERTGKVEVNGSPLIEVQGVLPEFCIQPASHQHFLKGPGSWSGFGRDFQPKDFAGVPLNSNRAYQHDNGFPRAITFSGGISGGEPLPLRVTETRASGDSLALRWQTSPALHYRLLGGATLDGDFQMIQEFIAPADGSLEILIPRTSEQSFYLLQAVQP
jgi:hypothetical protein